MALEDLSRPHVLGHPTQQMCVMEQETQLFGASVFFMLKIETMFSVSKLSQRSMDSASDREKKLQSAKYCYIHLDFFDAQGSYGSDFRGDRNMTKISYLPLCVKRKGEERTSF